MFASAAAGGKSLSRVWTFPFSDFSIFSFSATPFLAVLGRAEPAHAKYMEDNVEDTICCALAAVHWRVAATRALLGRNRRSSPCSRTIAARRYTHTPERVKFSGACGGQNSFLAYLVVVSQFLTPAKKLVQNPVLSF